MTDAAPQYIDANKLLAWLERRSVGAVRLTCAEAIAKVNELVAESAEQAHDERVADWAKLLKLLWENGAWGQKWSRHEVDDHALRVASEAVADQERTEQEK